MSHTPGPWELDLSGNYIIARDEDGNIFVVAETFENLLVGDETANIALSSLRRTCWQRARHSWKPGKGAYNSKKRTWRYRWQNPPSHERRAGNERR